MHKKYRTKTSQALNEFLSELEGRCFMAVDVSEYLDKHDIKVNLTTVYRNIDKLVEEGELVRFKATNSDSYSYRRADGHKHCDEHLHIQCKKCGKLVHVDDEIMSKIVQMIEDNYQFSLICKDSSLCRLCKDCR